MTSAIETALTELSANLRRMEQRHQAVGYKFDRLYDLIDAAREELASLTALPEGWVVAPPRLTQHMADAAKCVDARLSVWKYDDAYKAMLANIPECKA